MARSDAARKWDKENMTILSCRVTKEVAGQFKVACSKRGTTVNAALLAYVRLVIEETRE